MSVPRLRCICAAFLPPLARLGFGNLCAVDVQPAIARSIGHMKVGRVSLWYVSAMCRYTAAFLGRRLCAHGPLLTGGFVTNDTKATIVESAIGPLYTYGFFLRLTLLRT